tara:strand:- start:5019 stop:5456 length:438 start_codon:yes stop_codon:yes gene_type:complete
MWWRSYTPKNKPLDKRKPLIDRILNGDFEVGPYLMEIELVMHNMNDKYIENITAGGDIDESKYHQETSIDRARMKRLLEDHEKEETKKLDDIKRQFVVKFKMTSEQYDKEVLNTSARDLGDFYFRMDKKYGTYWQPNKMPKQTIY